MMQSSKPKRLFGTLGAVIVSLGLTSGTRAWPAQAPSGAGSRSGASR